VVALLLAAEELGARAREGWAPLHGIALAFWDAEELGLIGSTEWGEAHAEELRRSALAYVNADACVSGTRASASGSPGMLGAVREVLQRLEPAPPDRDAGHGDLWEQWSARAGEEGPSLGLPGSGSDFAVFLHHLSVPVVELGFGGNRGGQYHTAFDDFAIVDRFLDPGWHGHALAARALAGLLADLAEGRRGFDAAEAARTLARLVGREAGTEAPPAWSGEGRAARLSAALEALALRVEAARSGGAPCDEGSFLRALEDRDGLEGRPWFRNRLWSADLDHGYGAELLPGLAAARARGPEALEAELADLIGAIDAFAPSGDGAASR
jgi:N-acetylated-alpha-linked acidic dipeptidase